MTALTWLLILGAVALGALRLGAWMQKMTLANRCPRLKQYGFVFWQHALAPKQETTVTLRCILEKGHDCPHCVILNKGMHNQRSDWFEDEENECSASAPSIE